MRAKFSLLPWKVTLGGGGEGETLHSERFKPWLINMGPFVEKVYYGRKNSPHEFWKGSDKFS